MIPAFADILSLKEWARTRQSPDELMPVLMLKEGVVLEAVCRWSSPEALTPEVVERVLQAQVAWKPASTALLCLAENEQLSGEVLALLYRWAQAQMLEVPAKFQKVQPPLPPSGEIAPAQLARLLRMHGHEPPEGFMEPFQKEVRSWKQRTKGTSSHPSVRQREKREAEKVLAWHATYLLEDWVSLGKEEVHGVYRALKEQKGAMARLLQHPAVGVKIASYILADKLQEEGVMEAWLSRADLVEAPSLREKVVYSKWLQGCLLFLPQATSEEFVDMMWNLAVEGGLSHAMKLMKSRAATPRECAGLVRGLVELWPAAALGQIEPYLKPEQLTELTAADLLPVLQHEDTATRLQGQIFWAQLESARARQTQAVESAVAPVTPRSR